MSLPTVILPGFLESAEAYFSLEKSLLNLGFPTVTVPLKQRDWLATVGAKSVIPILKKLNVTVEHILNENSSSQINLIGHSAGGWISRIYLGNIPYGKDKINSLTWEAHPNIATLITLGTPHNSLERWTRRNLDFVNKNYPGAFYKNVNYICVSGKTIFGKRRLGNWFAYNSYKLTCGKGNTWGDGITPIESACLDGAKNIVIEDAMHSPRSSGSWYGSQQFIPIWSKYLA